MPVYFIGEHENGCSPIKIGVAKNIEARKRNLQTGSRAIRVRCNMKGFAPSCFHSASTGEMET